MQAQIPAIYSWGVAYKGIDRALIDLDLRYFDYANADLFGQSARDGGLGWRGVFAVATGGQYAVTDRLTLRAGYMFNTNPIPATATLFNVQLPGITQHTLSFGSSFALTEDITISAAWVHGFRNSIQGNLVQETGAFTKLDTQTAPSFLPVSGLNAQFELSAGADYRGGTERGAIDNFGSGILRFADRSTLTFAPQRSPELTRALLTQVNLDTLYLFSKEGWGPERVVRLFVRTINGIDNASSGGGPIPPDPPEFAEFRTLSDLLASLERRRVAVLTTQNRSTDVADIVPVDAIGAQVAVALKKEGLGVRALGQDRGYQLTQARPVKVVQIEPGSTDSPEVLGLVQILGLTPYQAAYDVEEATEGHVCRGPEPHEKITFTTRSILEVMYLLSKTVAVPAEHVREGLAPITRNADGLPFDWCMVTGDLFWVCVSKHRPKAAYVAVPYRGYWYSIDDRDATSKVTLNLFNELLRLQKTGTAEGQPVLTLPALHYPQV